MNKQQGFVSIITASIVMIIITLVVIGFSQVMQREQRQALDRQLSSQAVYAAETAVNDVYQLLQTGALRGIEEKPDCDLSDTTLFPTGGVVNPGSDNEAAYTCVTFDQTPSTLEFNNGSITTQQSKIFPIQPKANNNNVMVRSLTFEWNGARGETGLGALETNCSGELPSNPLAVGVPILRIDLVRFPTENYRNTPERVNVNNLIDQTTTFFLYPSESCGESSRNYDTLRGLTNKGSVVFVDCNSSQAYACSFTINNMQNGGPTVGSNRYFARIKSIYNDADLRINGEATAAGGDFEFIGAQINIDATGKSNDVLRRISVQLANPVYPIPEFVVQGLDGVCKDITIAPPSLPGNPNGQAFDGCY